MQDTDTTGFIYVINTSQPYWSNIPKHLVLYSIKGTLFYRDSQYFQPQVVPNNSKVTQSRIILAIYNELKRIKGVS